MPVKAALGTAGVSLGLIGAILGVLTIAVGLRRQRPDLQRAGLHYVWLVLGGAVIAALAMEWALLSHDFSLKYVAENHSRSTPLTYTIASLWAALEGSIILWALVLAGYGAAVVRRFRRDRDDKLVAWAVLTLLAVSVFFFALMLGPANPFRTLSVVPTDGPGPNPLLQN
ncbi:MAG TPA: heme lyase CcmF/NrfE family subunit, partial [Acidimicrobiales bacterium]|nr:heme lyase CcmF/NrfE family subunit [Acidimicrobiales bacterium]